VTLENANLRRGGKKINQAEKKRALCRGGVTTSFSMGGGGKLKEEMEPKGVRFFNETREIKK